MAVGGSGVAQRPKGEFSDARSLVHSLLGVVGDIDTYQQRLDALEGAENRALAAKREAGHAIKNAETAAKKKAEVIIQAAEEQAQDRLGAVQDLEARILAEHNAWKEEKAAEQAKLRSDRSRTGVATRVANEAKAQAEAAKAAADAAAKVAEERVATIESKWSAVQKIMCG